MGGMDPESSPQLNLDAEVDASTQRYVERYGTEESRTPYSKDNPPPRISVEDASFALADQDNSRYLDQREVAKVLRVCLLCLCGIGQGGQGVL